MAASDPNSAGQRDRGESERAQVTATTGVSPLDDSMSSEHDRQPLMAERAEAFVCKIVQRTGGRIAALEVEFVDDRVVIRGTVPCYYIKQLALQAVLDLIGSAVATRIDLNIQVLCGDRNPTVP
jgi:hypothetical protein